MNYKFTFNTIVLNDPNNVLDNASKLKILKALSTYLKKLKEKQSKLVINNKDITKAMKTLERNKKEIKDKKGYKRR